MSHDAIQGAVAQHGGGLFAGITSAISGAAGVVSGVVNGILDGYHSFQVGLSRCSEYCAEGARVMAALTNNMISNPNRSEISSSALDLAKSKIEGNPSFTLGRLMGGPSVAALSRALGAGPAAGAASGVTAGLSALMGDVGYYSSKLGPLTPDEIAEIAVTGLLVRERLGR